MKKAWSRLPQKILVLLVGGPYHDQAAVGAGHRAADQHDVILGVDPHYQKIANGDLAVAVLTGGGVPLLGSAGTSVAGMRADGTRLAMHLLGPVRGGQALEIVPLHD